MADEPVKEARQKLAATLLAILRKTRPRYITGCFTLNEILEAKRLQDADSCPGDVIEEAPEAPPPVIPETVPDQSVGSEEVKPQPEPESEIKNPETTGGMTTMDKNPEELTNNNEASGNASASGTRPSGTSRPSPATRPSTTSRPSTTARPSTGTRPSTTPNTSGSSSPSTSTRPSTRSSQDEEFDLSAEALAGEALTSIRGIAEKRQQYLKELGIETIADLLTKACTIAQRKEIANKLMYTESVLIPSAYSLRVYERHVASWVKQADLRRTPGMDADTAYLLVQLGVRHMEDLAKLDVEKAYPIMVSLTTAQPDIHLIAKDKLADLIKEARSKSGDYPEAQEKLQRLLLESLRNTASNVPADINDAYVKQLLTDLCGHLMDINVKDILGPRSNIECDDPAPTYLFTEEKDVPNVMDDLDIPTVVNIAKIRSGIEALKNMPMELNPPRFIRGRVFMVRAGQILPESEKDRRGYALYDALVELDGTATSSTDSKENAEKPSAYTDGDGWFTIELAAGTNLCQKLTLTVSQGSCKQKFSISADTLLDSCPERKIVNDMLLLDKLYEDYLHDDELYQALKTVQNRIENGEEVNEEDQAFYDAYKNDMEDLYREIELAEERIRDLEHKIIQTDSTTNDMSRILRNLTEKKDIVADLSDSPFVVNENIFKGLRTDQPKVMPSVKLMEQDDKPVYLPTDTAPSKIYQYSMLQRLVEPDISSKKQIEEDPKKTVARSAINDALDITAFRRQLANDSTTLNYMCSLGIGYNLNMHQAWVPDGFALGTLLYSLVLAPGEEQRLVVRENKQSYSIVDEASGTDGVSESYDLSQQDDTDAAFNYAMNQMMKANSNYQSSSSGWSIGGAASWSGVGLSGGYSSSKSKGSANASQRNSHSEASSAAQTFQHGIKMASEKLSQAHRLSVSLATAEQEDSVATRIIANHNHSHTMTVQYWEVMRRYRLETCVDSVDLVLFVPMKPICFAPVVDKDGKCPYTLEELSKKTILSAAPSGEDYNHGYDDGYAAGFKASAVSADSAHAIFSGRYRALIDNADVLERALPYSYRTGLNVIRKYSAMTDWHMETKNPASNVITLEIKAHLLKQDRLTAALVLKNGKGRVNGIWSFQKYSIMENLFSTREELYRAIRDFRELSVEEVPSTSNYSGESNSSAVNTQSCTFYLPDGVNESDISSIRIGFSCGKFEYVLKEASGRVFTTEDGDRVGYSQYDLMKLWQEEYHQLVKDNTDSYQDRKMMSYYEGLMHESWIRPNVTISPREMSAYGTPYFAVTKLTGISAVGLKTQVTTDRLSTNTTIPVSLDRNVLSWADLEKAERTLQHVMSNTMRYSQAVWNSLTLSERAMLLDQYTIHMNWDDIAAVDADTPTTDIPLLNCINVHKMLGFYGNCMLFPFTYPESLAKEIGRTAAELQDTLLRHHTNNFRVPITTISLPTNGMVGEAVLGATNVSEEIDLTRFWNWQDSPIDKMDITSEFLNGEDYLSDKKTMTLEGLNLSGVSNPGSASIPDVLNALISKKPPEFENITGQQFLKDLVSGSTSSADAARTAAMTNSFQSMQKAMDHAEKMQDKETELAKAYINKGYKPDGTLLEKGRGTGEGTKPGGSGDGTGIGNKPGGSGDGTGSSKPGGAGGNAGSAGGGASGGKTADILINYYNGASGVTTVEQKPSGTAVNPEKKPPAAPDNDISQEDLDKLVDAALNGMPGSAAGDISQEDLDKLVELGQAASKDAMKNTPKAKKGA